MPRRLGQAEDSQCLQVFPCLSFGDPVTEPLMHFPQRQPLRRRAQHRQHPLLPLRHILRHPLRRHITRGAEAREIPDPSKRA